MMRVRFNLHSPRRHHLSCLHQQLLHHTHHTRLELQLSLHGVTAIPQLLAVPTEDGSFPNPFSLGHVPGEKLTGNGGVQSDQVGWRIRVHWLSLQTSNQIYWGISLNTIRLWQLSRSANLLRSRACLAMFNFLQKAVCFVIAS